MSTISLAEVTSSRGMKISAYAEQFALVGTPLAMVAQAFREQLKTVAQSVDSVAPILPRFMSFRIEQFLRYIENAQANSEKQTIADTLRALFGVPDETKFSGATQVAIELRSIDEVLKGMLAISLQGIEQVASSFENQLVRAVEEIGQQLAEVHRNMQLAKLRIQQYETTITNMEATKATAQDDPVKAEALARYQRNLQKEKTALLLLQDRKTMLQTQRQAMNMVLHAMGITTAVSESMASHQLGESEPLVVIPA